MSNFIVQIPLITEKHHEDILSKRFEIGRKIYNSLVRVTKKRYIEMIKTKLYREIKSELKQIREMYKKYDTLLWNRLRIPVCINYNNPYEYKAM